MDYINLFVFIVGYLLESLFLGKSLEYLIYYDFSLLFLILCVFKCVELQISGILFFFGVDLWMVYEIFWLNLCGKFQIVIVIFMVLVDLFNIIELKFFKLYLNFFNQEWLESVGQLIDKMCIDLMVVVGVSVQVMLIEFLQFGQMQFGEFLGLLLDWFDVEIELVIGVVYFDGSLLCVNIDEVMVEEILVLYLFKFNCLVISQFDWGSVQIQYVGVFIDQEWLLKYIIGFCEYNEFYE